MSTPKDLNEAESLAQAMESYLLGNLSDEQLDAFEAYLLLHPESARWCVDAMHTVAMTREFFRNKHEQCAVLSADQTLESFHELLAELGAAEQRAQAQLVHLIDPTQDGRSLWRYWPIMIPTTIAALLAVALVLIVTLPNQTPPSTNRSGVASTPPVAALAVATIKAEHDAVWADRKFGPGFELQAGDLLTLQAGFAEITTARGAVVILEAPATFELLENDNAIRLHRGKLVGICETPSSKGFAVHTKHLRVTDIGTVFGVMVSSDDRTHTQVFQGKVRAAVINAIGHVQSVQTLISGQALALDQAGTPIPQAAIETEEYQRALTLSQTDLFPPITKVIRRGLAPDNLLSGNEEADALQVFLERKGVELQSDLMVDLNQSSPEHLSSTADFLTLPAGLKVDAYLLHFDPLDTGALLHHGQFVVSFDRPILGVIGYASAVYASNPLFILSGKQYLNELPSAGLERDDSDQVAISPDGKTLELKLFAAKGFVDQVRVLVAAEKESPSLD